MNILILIYDLVKMMFRVKLLFIICICYIFLDVVYFFRLSGFSVQLNAWRRSDIFTVNFEHISQLVLVFLLTLNCRLGSNYYHMEFRWSCSYFYHWEVLKKFG